MKTTRYVLIALCVLTLFACRHKSKSVSEAIKNESENHTDAGNTAQTVIADDKLITPGKSIGQMVLNEATSEAMSRLGKPDFADAAMGKSVSVWYDDHNKKYEYQ